MSTRRLTNIFKRKLLSSKTAARNMDIFSGLTEKENNWFKSQFRDLSKLGGNLIVMRMGN